jgi:hypothetical protein
MVDDRRVKNVVIHRTENSTWFSWDRDRRLYPTSTPKGTVPVPLFLIHSSSSIQSSVTCKNFYKPTVRNRPLLPCSSQFFIQSLRLLRYHLLSHCSIVNSALRTEYEYSINYEQPKTVLPVWCCNLRRAADRRHTTSGESIADAQAVSEYR